MISRMSHATIFVLNQQEALEFYTQKLGFEVRMDATMEGGFRWLTVGTKEQPDLEIILFEVKPGPMMDDVAAKQFRSLIEQGKMGAGVFQTKDCRKTYEELKANGVQFLSPPQERFYGVEAIMKDNSGNWFSMTQPAGAMSQP
jgi:catechol 2,3-dioxygenase-like lactoylglutathione lyase family enzyme